MYGIWSPHLSSHTDGANDDSLWENGIIACTLAHSCVGQEMVANYTECWGYESCTDASIFGDHLGPSNIRCYGADSCEELQWLVLVVLNAMLNGVVVKLQKYRYKQHMERFVRLHPHKKQQ